MPRHQHQRNKLYPTNIMKLTKPTTSITLLLLLLLISIFTLYYTLFLNYHQTPKTLNRQQLQIDDYNHFHNFFLSSGTNSTLASYLRDLTLHPHLAGTEPSALIREYVKNQFQNMGLETEVVEYEVLLSYPKEVRVEMMFVNGSVRVLELVEPGMDKEVVVPYHAYSKEGVVMGRAVYVNYGREEDYRELLEVMGVNVSGCVVVMRRGGGLGRGGAVEIAGKKGAIGVLMFTEEGFREEGVERGSVGIGGVGDVLSPGWGAVKGGEKMDVMGDEVLKRFTRIPSVPISVRVAKEVLRLLGGHKVPEEWMGRVKFRGFGVGPGPVMLNLTYLVSS